MGPRGGSVLPRVPRPPPPHACTYPRLTGTPPDQNPDQTAGGNGKGRGGGRVCGRTPSLDAMPCPPPLKVRRGALGEGDKQNIY